MQRCLAHPEITKHSNAKHTYLLVPGMMGRVIKVPNSSLEITRTQTKEQAKKHAHVLVPGVLHIANTPTIALESTALP